VLCSFGGEVKGAAWLEASDEADYRDLGVYGLAP
jgi:hypothetical protein